jgi:hypothetical protein
MLVLLALALDGAMRGEDFLGEVLRDVGARSASWAGRAGAGWLATLQTELGPTRQLGIAGGAATSELPSALEAELGALGILGGTARAAHLERRYESSSSSAFASFRSAVSNPSVNQP